MFKLTKLNVKKKYLVNLNPTELNCFIFKFIKKELFFFYI